MMKIDHKKLMNKLTDPEFIAEDDIWSPSETVRNIRGKIMEAIDESVFVCDDEYRRWVESRTI